MKRAVFAILAWALSAGAAMAQQSVADHYRAYQAALERNDLAAAEAAAGEALAASQARDGDGGATAVLALNLATVRFLNNDAEGALAPAQRALDLAQARGDASRVSPVLARLVLGRVQLALNQPDAAARLLAALEEAETVRVAPSEIYEAAVQLGRFSYAAKSYPLARHAWSIAANHAEGSRFEAAYASAHAQVGAAAAIVLEDLTRSRFGRGQLRAETAALARRELRDAIDLLQPLAEIESPDGEMTLAQTTYAEALAWRAVVNAKINSDHLHVPEEDPEAQGDGAREIDVPVSASQPRCLVRFSYAGAYDRLFPRAALEDGALAGVAVRFRINEAGEVTDAETVAIVGREEFARSVNNSTQRWRVARLDESPPGCRMAMTVITSISFSVY